MSIQTEIDRINNNVQNTLNTIAETGVAVGTGSDALPAAAAALANEKADVDHDHSEYLPLSGGQMTGAIDASGTTQVIDFGTTGYFRGKTGSGNRFDMFGLINSTRLVVGGSYPALELKGKNTRPTYNGSDMALYSDIPAASPQTVTLTAAGWDAAALTQTVTVAGATATNVKVIAPNEANVDEYATYGIRAIGEGAGTVTFTCTTVPAIDLLVNIAILGG